jgi:hypothetical protein
MHQKVFTLGTQIHIPSGNVPLLSKNNPLSIVYAHRYFNLTS